MESNLAKAKLSVTFYVQGSIYMIIYAVATKFKFIQLKLYVNCILCMEFVFILNVLQGV